MNFYIKYYRQSEVCPSCSFYLDPLCRTFIFCKIQSWYLQRGSMWMRSESRMALTLSALVYFSVLVARSGGDFLPPPPIEHKLLIWFSLPNLASVFTYVWTSWLIVTSLFTEKLWNRATSAVITKKRNDPKPAETTWNDPKPAETSPSHQILTETRPSLTETSGNKPLPPRTGSCGI